MPNFRADPSPPPPPGAHRWTRERALSPPRESVCDLPREAGVTVLLFFFSRATAVDRWRCAGPTSGSASQGSFPGALAVQRRTSPGSIQEYPSSGSGSTRLFSSKTHLTLSPPPPPHKKTSLPRETSAVPGLHRNQAAKTDEKQQLFCMYVHSTTIKWFFYAKTTSLVSLSVNSRLPDSQYVVYV